MKKILLAALCALCTMTASAQRASSSTSFFSSEKSNDPVTVGIRAGMNSSSIGGDYSSLYKSKIGFHAGLAVDVPILESFGINTGVFYSMKGAKAKGTDESVTTGYVEIPVLASYRYHFNEKVRLDIDLGPYFAYGVHGSDDIFDSDLGWMKRFDAGLAFGAGVTIKKFYAGLHYEAGLANVSDVDGVSAKNNNLMLTVGVNF